MSWQHFTQAIKDWLLIFSHAWLLLPVLALLITVAILMLANWAAKPRK